MYPAAIKGLFAPCIKFLSDFKKQNVVSIAKYIGFCAPHKNYKMLKSF